MALFTDGLYDKLAIRANTLAKKLADGIRKSGYGLLYPVETNMVIPVFPAGVAEKLRQSYGFYDRQKLEDNIAVRLLTSWATPESKIDEFIEDLSNCSKY